MRPYGERLLVEKVEAETQTPGGIYIPESQRQDDLARIVKLGLGTWDDESLCWMGIPGLDEGDIVMLQKCVPFPVVVHGKQMYIVPVGAVIAVMN